MLISGRQRKVWQIQWKKKFCKIFFCVKFFLGENLLGEHYLSEHFWSRVPFSLLLVSRAPPERNCNSGLKLTKKYVGHNLTKKRRGQTRLTYNCAHLRSTKESLTIWVKIFWVKIFLSENFLGENFFGWKIFGWNLFGWKIFGWKFFG